MSDFEAIGGVGMSLRALLEDRVELPAGVAGATVPVSIGAPPSGEGEPDGPQLNLFLYQVTRNGALANQEIPGHGASGAAYGHPPLALDLHFLLTAYGTLNPGDESRQTDDSVAHSLLGSAMRVLHDEAILGEEVEDANGNQILDPSLQGEYERIKLTLEPLTLEDAAKVWTALNRSFRLSVAYQVSVVQVESRRPQAHPQPVGAPPPAGPRVAVGAGGRPVIEAVHAARRPGPYAKAGETLVIEGHDLAGDPTLAWVDGRDAAAAVTSARADRVTLVVPDEPALQPGIRSLRVGHGALLGDPPSPRVGAKSNTAAFVLIPAIDTVAVVGGGDPVLRVRGDRLLAPAVECLTLVGDRAVPADEYDPASTARELRMPLPDGAAGGESVRVRVNGAESLDEARLPP
jgi:hypothetical protein